MSLSRYQMRRGAKSSELPSGVRQDTRKHTQHPLRPPADAVARYLTNPSDEAWSRFAWEYRDEVLARYREGRAPFDDLAELARREHVHLGCSCPTKKNPSVRRCHTWLALEWMAETYPDLDVRFPEEP